MASSSESQSYSPPYPNVLATGCQLTDDVNYTGLITRWETAHSYKFPTRHHSINLAYYIKLKTSAGMISTFTYANINAIAIPYSLKEVYENTQLSRYTTCSPSRNPILYTASQVIISHSLFFRLIILSK